MARALLALPALVLILAGCTDLFDFDEGPDPAIYGDDTGGTLQTDQIQITGSSSMAPLLLAWAQDFEEARGVAVEVTTEGSTGGATALCLGQTDIAAMSRQIEDEEDATCSRNNVDVMELRVAEDAIAVVTPTSNDFVTDLELADLEAIFRGTLFAQTWDEVDSTYPPEPIRLCIPDGASGTFQSFNDMVLPAQENGTEPRVGPGVEQFVDDDELLQCIADDQWAIGYVSLARYLDTPVEEVQTVAVDGVEPTQDTLADGSYDLHRRLYFYVHDEVEGVVADFLRYTFHAEGGQPVVDDLGYAPLDSSTRTLIVNKLS